MDRRKFVKTNSIAFLGLYLPFTEIKALDMHLNNPGFSKLNLKETPFFDQNENRKLALLENAIFQYNNLTNQDILNSLQTQYRLAYGKRRNDKLTRRSKKDILSSKNLTIDEISSACNYKNDPTIMDILPKLTEYGYTGIGSVGAGILATGVVAASTVSLPIILTGVGLTTIGFGGATLSSYIGDRRKQENEIICANTIYSFDNLSEADKEFIQSEEIQEQIKIPYRRSTGDLVSENEDKSELRKNSKEAASENNNQLVEQKKFLQLYLQNLKKEQELKDEKIKAAQTQLERKKLLEEIEAEVAENSYSIYLAEVFISKVLGDPAGAAKFSKVASSINKMYGSYSKLIMDPPAISNLAFSANWVSGGLLIMSVLQNDGNGEANAWESLFKQLQQLTELIIQGFEAVLQNQIAILERLSEIFNLIQTNGIIEQSYLIEIKDSLNKIEQKLNKVELDLYMNKVVDSNSQLSTLFGDKRFNLKKDSYRVPFNQYVTNYVKHGTIFATKVEALNGYNQEAVGKDFYKIANSNISLEQQIGLIPLAHEKSGVLSVDVDFNSFKSKVANPIEWNRASNLYIQAILTGKPNTKFVINHLNLFKEQGNLLGKFITSYSKPSFHQKVNDNHFKLSTDVLKQIANWVRNDSVSKGLNPILKRYLQYNQKVKKLNRNVFRLVNTEYPQRHNWNQERDVLKSHFSGKTHKIYINEFDGYNGNEPLYTIDYDIFGLINFLKNRGVLSYSKVNVVANNNYKTKYTKHKIKITKRELSGLEITFFQKKSHVAGKPHKGPFSPAYIQLDFSAGPKAYNGISTKINAYQWKKKAKDLLAKSKNPEQYFLLKSSYPQNHQSSISQFRYTFTDLLANELLQELNSIFLEIGKSISTNKTLLYETYSNLANKMDINGYLLMAIRSIFEYKSKVTSSYDYSYGERLGTNVTSSLLNLPSFSFFNEILVVLQHTLINGSLINENNQNNIWQTQANLLRNDDSNLKPIEDVFVNAIQPLIDKQHSDLKQKMPVESDDMNFNISYNLASIQLMTDHFKVQSQ